MQLVTQQIEAFTGPWAPFLYVILFLGAGLLIIWRLETMTHRGVEGTVLGTLFMPYFSGLGNLIFVAVVLRQNGPPSSVAINSLVNNLTNLCVLLAIPALIWGLSLKTESKKKKDRLNSQLHRLSLALTLVAMIFFSGVVWLLAQDGTLDRYDGLTLVALFLFWQIFHVYEVLKENTRTDGSRSPAIVLDIVLVLAGSYLTLVSVDGIVAWLMNRQGELVSARYLGVITGLLMVLPNAVLAFYYAAKQRADVVYASQIGDAHICIPLCIGIFAIFRPMPVPSFVTGGLLFLASAALLHLICIVGLRRLPAIVAGGLILVFAIVAYLGFI